MELTEQPSGIANPASAGPAPAAPGFGRMPGFGELAPSFIAASDVNPKFNFLAMGGQWILLMFFGSLAEPLAREALKRVLARRAMFDDDRALFFGVSFDPADRGERGLKGSLPGIRYFWDFDKAVSRLYGLVADASFKPMAFLLDPGRRIAASVPIALVDSVLRRLEVELQAPQPDHGAPVLTVPLVLEPDFCRALIELYDAQGGGVESGFMREVDGMTVPMRDNSVKRRRDCDIPIDSPLHGGLRLRLAHRLIPQIEQAFCWKATRIERYIVARYGSEDRGFFSRHRDNTTPGTAHRRFAVSINLNDDYEGGELRFPEFGQRTYRPPMGGATVFNCSLLHEATRVTHGVRFATLPFLYDDDAAAIREANRDKLIGEASAPRALRSAARPAPAPESVPRDTDIKAAEAMVREGRLKEAAMAFRALAATEADQFDVQFGLGYTAFALEDFAGAAAAYQRAIALAPEHATAHNNLANALQKLGRTEEAQAAYARSISINPRNPGPHGNLGHLLLAAGAPEAAAEAYAAAVAAGGTDIGMLMNYGAALHQMGRLEAALEQFDRAIAATDESSAPEQIATIYTNRAYARLAHGLLEEGWRDYEHRWRAPSMFLHNEGRVTAGVRARLEPGLSLQDLAGSRVLVIGEQGIGDEIMFASILPDLQAVAAEVRLFCEPRLRRLFESSFGGVRLVGPEGLREPLDHVVAMGSLGRLFRNRLEDFPGTPYLRSSGDARRRWAERLGPANGRKRIGVSWKGGVVKTGLKARSMLLSTLEPILADEAYEIVSLQYGDNSEEVVAANAGLPRPIRLFDKAEIDDFDELGGLVANLDLVVSVQTALVHLCGALGAPALVMVPHVAEWRYGAQGSSMPWYGSVALFRQGEDRSWAPVVERVAEEAGRRLKS